MSFTESDSLWGGWCDPSYKDKTICLRFEKLLQQTTLLSSHNAHGHGVTHSLENRIELRSVYSGCIGQRRLCRALHISKDCDYLNGCVLQLLIILWALSQTGLCSRIDSDKLQFAYLSHKDHQCLQPVSLVQSPSTWHMLWCHIRLTTAWAWMCCCHVFLAMLPSIRNWC